MTTCPFTARRDPLPHLFGRLLACWLTSRPIARGLVSLEGLAVTPRNRPHAAPDVLVGLVGQVRQGHPQRPLRRLEAAAVQEDDAVVLRQPERQIQRMDVLL